MTVLSTPRHPLVKAAFRDARALYGDHQVEDRPALAHSAAVAAALVRHVPDASAELTAAALLHDAPEFAPAGVDVPVFLAGRYGEQTAHVVLALAAEHQALDQPDPPIDTTDYPVLLLSTVDKAVAFRSNIDRARRTGDAGAYFAAKVALVNLLDYFRAYHQAGLGLLPETLCQEYGQAISGVDTALREHARTTHIKQSGHPGARRRTREPGYLACVPAEALGHFV
ncbi:metal-dependent phosphohydrolase [Actinoplanes sp. NPDC051343]|uniref:metal-dependent phosphohydrolase n=1 Tax=Actinoplanes sp. NPDC051343 TaxID=3363906 RepID=UPI0037AB8068